MDPKDLQEKLFENSCLTGLMIFNNKSKKNNFEGLKNHQSVFRDQWSFRKNSFKLGLMKSLEKNPKISISSPVAL